jgi:hypothetical protein
MKLDGGVRGVALVGFALSLACCGKTAAIPPAPTGVAPLSIASIPDDAVSIDALPWDAAGPAKIIGYYRMHVTCPPCPPKRSCEPCPPTGDHFGATRDDQSALLLVDFAEPEPLLAAGQRYLLEGDLRGEQVRQQRCVGCTPRLSARTVSAIPDTVALPDGGKTTTTPLSAVPSKLRVFAINASGARTTDRRAIEELVRATMSVKDPSARQALVERIGQFSMMSTDIEGLQQRARLPRDLPRETAPLQDEAAILAMLDVVAFLADLARRSDSSEKARDLDSLISTMALPGDATVNRARLVRELREGLGDGLWARAHHPK